MATRVAVLGLGIMGSEMARNAARAGLETVGWDRKPEHALALAPNGVNAAKTPQDAVQGADVVVTMVADGNAVLSVMENYGAFAAMKAESCWVQMSTIGVEGTQSAVRLASTRPEIAFVDAPVSGSRGPAEEGKLVILASGDRARGGEAIQEFFDAIGSRTHWLGEAGKGTRMKLLFNAWLGMLGEAVAEVAIFGESLGISPKDFATLAQGGPLVPPWAAAKLEKIASNKTQEPEFPLRWAHKDILLALSAAGEERSRLPVLNKIAITWADAVGEFGAYDLSAIYLALQKPQEVAGP